MNSNNAVVKPDIELEDKNDNGKIEISSHREADKNNEHIDT